MSADLLERARPALTVFSHRAMVDPATASRAVLRALPGMDASTADAALATRGGAPSSGAAPAGRAFMIRARAIGAGVEGSRTAAVRFTNDTNLSYRIHAWE